MSDPEPIWCPDHERVEEIDDQFVDEDRDGRPIHVAITQHGCTFTTPVRPARDLGSAA